VAIWTSVILMGYW